MDSTPPALAAAPQGASLTTPGRPAATGRRPYVVLTGKPNSGKTTLFNALTGLRARVGNYAGVTVERKEGRLQGAPADTDVRVLDLPGAYSLSPQSLDEQISRDVLLNRLPELPPAGPSSSSSMRPTSNETSITPPRSSNWAIRRSSR